MVKLHTRIDKALNCPRLRKGETLQRLGEAEDQLRKHCFTSRNGKQDPREYIKVLRTHKDWTRYFFRVDFNKRNEAYAKQREMDRKRGIYRERKLCCIFLFQSTEGTIRKRLCQSVRQCCIITITEKKKKRTWGEGKSQTVRSELLYEKKGK